jgi:hypothetical protein
MRSNRFLIILFVAGIYLCSCSDESKKREYFVVELPPRYKGYINIVFMNNSTAPEQIHSKGVYLSVRADSSGLVLVKDEYKDWISRLQLSFIDGDTRRSAPIFKSGGDSSRVFVAGIIDIENANKNKCFRAFVTKDLVPNSDTSSLLPKRVLKAYQIQKLNLQL